MAVYLFVAIVFFTAALQGITGFGSALIAAPLLLLFLDKTTSVIALTFVSLAMNGYLFARIQRPIKKELFYLLFCSSLIGLPLGIFLLNLADTSTIRIVAGSLSLLFGILIYAKFVRLGERRWTTALSGVLAGLLHTSISMSGPPVVLLVAGRDTEKDVARRTFAAFFLAMSVITSALFAVTGTFTDSGLKFGVYGLPAAFLGAYVGAKVSSRVSHRQFMMLTFLLVCLTGIFAIYSGLSVQ